MTPSIFLHSEDVEFSVAKSKKVIQWISLAAKSRSFEIGEINYIFCSDSYLLIINKEYLGHDYYTDIITFDQSDQENQISGDIFISIDRVRENAETFNVSFTDELHRVMIHGVLHLIGVNDKTPDEKSEMRKLEDHYLALREF